MTTRIEDRSPEWQEHVRATVAAAPPMSARQIAKLNALFTSHEKVRKR